MSDLIQKIDAKTKLAGANKLEVLTFSLGTDGNTGRSEVFGINVFKVKEVIKTPEITSAPGMPSAVKGMVSIRGVLVPVIDLAEYCNVASSEPKEILILSEYNGRVQGFLVSSVDTILRISWSDMKIPPSMLSGNLRGLVTAVTELANNKLVMMLDVERVLSELSPSEEEDMSYNQISPITNTNKKLVFFADDSSVARKQIQKTLDALGVQCRFSLNGKDAWEALDMMANTAQIDGVELSDRIGLILTDVEMPEMDGFALTKKIKSDGRFANIPVIMHSSLSGSQNQVLGKSVGVDNYISKFEPQRLAKVIREYFLGEDK